MTSLLLFFHIILCVLLVGAILLQAGKGADIGAVFGGTSQTLFGGRGPATFLNKLTIVVSVIFLLTSVWLTKIGQHKGTESVIGTVPLQSLPVQTAPAVPQAPVPSTPAK